MEIKQEKKINKNTLRYIQSVLSKHERKIRIRFATMTKREKDILSKTVKLSEETGELANDILSVMSLQRKSKLDEFNIKNLYEEFADVVITTAMLANKLHVNLERAVRDKLKKVLTSYAEDR